MAQPMLLDQGGSVARHIDADEMSRLRQDNDELREENALLKAELAALRGRSERAVRGLRQILLPLHTALKEVFGEMDIAAPEQARQESSGTSTAPDVDPRKRAVWDSWKQKLGGSAAKVIDALLLHGEMNTQQLAIAVGLHRTTIPAIIYRLNQAGLINKNGGRFSLKQL